MTDYATLSELEGRNETDVDVDEMTFRIRAAKLRDILVMESLDSADTQTEDTAQAMEDILKNCVVKPELETSDDVSALGRFQLPLFNEILTFSMGGMDLDEMAEEVAE